MKKLTLGIIGPSRAGKDEAAEWFVNHCGLKYNGTTSVVISRKVAMREGITFAQAHAQRHERKMYWRALGDKLRANDPAYLAKEILNPDSNLLVGVRARIEMIEVRRLKLCDLVIWVDRDVPNDPTLEFGPELCDIVIQNRWDVPSYHSRLEKLALALGLEVSG